jgi:hypothetical protein
MSAEKRAEIRKKRIKRLSQQKIIIGQKRHTRMRAETGNKCQHIGKSVHSDATRINPFCPREGIAKTGAKFGKTSGRRPIAPVGAGKIIAFPDGLPDMRLAPARKSCQVGNTAIHIISAEHIVHIENEGFDRHFQGVSGILIGWPCLTSPRRTHTNGETR